MKPKEYAPPEGFVDLREYNLTKTQFSRCAEAQHLLFMVQSQKEYYQKHNPQGWRQAQEISANLQMYLAVRGLKQSKNIIRGGDTK